jgi:adenosylcobinamide-GDP ribazoletransferase
VSGPDDEVDAAAAEPRSRRGPTGLLEAAAFLTAVGGAQAPTRAALPWFGVVGAFVGAAVGAVWWAGSRWWAVGVAAALALVADAALTGLLHLDGLADSGDGLLPPVGRAKRLEILRDPRSGAFGVVVVVLVLLLRWTALASSVPDAAAIAALASVWCTARVAMAVTAVTVPYARDQGLASAFRGPGASVVPVLAVGVPVALATAVIGHDPWLTGVLAVAATAIGAAAVVTFARARLGGFTGDVLGAAGVIGETLGLLVLAVQG